MQYFLANYKLGVDIKHKKGLSATCTNTTTLNLYTMTQALFQPAIQLWQSKGCSAWLTVNG